MTTKFLRRTAPDPAEVTIRIHQDAGAILGEVTCPEGLAGSHTAAEAERDGSLGVHQALASAISLSLKHGNKVIVVDEENLWRPEWGDLEEEES